MGLVLNIDSSVVTGKRVMTLSISKDGDVLNVEIYKDRGNMKIFFEGDKSFLIGRSDKKDNERKIDE